MAQSFQAEVDLLLRVMREAGERIADAWGRVIEVRHKGSIDLVTDIDRGVEMLLLERLATDFPDDGFWAEESGAQEGRSGRRWIIDPLDGTTNFAHGFPMFATTAALEVDETVEIGATYNPLLDELFWARRGDGAWCNGARLCVSKRSVIRESLLATGFAYDRHENPDNNLAEFAAFVTRARGVRRAGAAALDLAHLAAGRLDGFWEQGLHPWDTAAGRLLVEEAGGTISTYTATPHRLSSRTIVASNGSLHDSILAVLAQARTHLPQLDGV